MLLDSLIKGEIRMHKSKKAVASYMSESELSEYIGIPKKTLQRWRLAGASPFAFSKFGNHIIYSKSVVDKSIVGGSKI